MRKEIIPCFISSYVPKNCGIATFTENLFKSYQSIYGNKGMIIAVDDQLDRDFPSEVDLVFDRNKASDYLKAAEYINDSEYTVVNLQHEFGLFGGPEGRLIIKLLEKLRKPVVTTLHTVLQNPNLGYYTSLMELINHSDRMLTLSHKGAEILREVYYTPAEKIVMAPHGVPDLPFMDPEDLKEKWDTKGRTVLLTFGLLSPGKGLEMVLDALPEVVAKHPEVLYVIMGKTHPDIVRLHGESYRESLQKMVRDNALEDNVLFINKFMSNEDLFDYINASDVYITPYMSPEQISSGTLAYAVGLGKAIVSTPYWYAKELLADGRGALIPFKNTRALTEALLNLLSDRNNMDKMRLSAYEYGREMIWSQVSAKYQATFATVSKEYPKKRLKKISALRNSSLYNMGGNKIVGMFERITDEFGTFQFAKYGLPDYTFGYSTDDMGRALDVIIRWYKAVPAGRPWLSDEYRLAQKYLSFILYAQKEDGRFHNFIGYDRSFQDDVGSDDTFGRALTGLGGTIAYSSDQLFINFAKDVFDKAVQFLPTEEPWSPYPRSLAYANCGFAGYLRKFRNSDQVTTLLKTNAEHLVELYEANRSSNWHWFEPIITYGNAKVPYSLMQASSILEEPKYLEVALESLDFITAIQYNGTYFDLIGNQGWLHKGGHRAYFDQQPIEIGYLVEAYCKAMQLTGKTEYRNLAKRAYYWFFGNNRLDLPMYDTARDYPLDGLSATGSSKNSGAEALISFALAVTSLKEIKTRRPITKKKSRR